MKFFKLINDIIPRNFIFKTKFLFSLFVLNSFLEAMGIGLFIPLLVELTNSELFFIQKLKMYFNPIYNYLNLNNWITFFLILIILTYLIKNLTLSFIAYYENKFVQNLTVDLSSRLLEIYLNQNYLFFKKFNSSELIRNINIEISTFVVFLKNLLIFISQAVFMFGILIILFVYNTQITLLSIFIFLTLLYCYNFFTKNTINQLGRLRLNNSDLAIKHLQQSFGAIKEIKINNVENLFTQLYKIVCQKIAISVTSYSFLQQLPRLFLEFFIILFACLGVMFSIGIYDLSLIIVTIGVFSITAVKLIPISLKIYQSMQGMIYCLPSLKVLSKQFNLKTNIRIKNYQKKKNIFNKSLVLNKIYFKYPNQKKPVFKNLSLKLSFGEKVAIVGSSGIGKTTLIELLMGLILPNKGKIYVDKYLVNNVLEDYQKIIGYVPQDIYLMDDTVLNNITFLDKSKLNKSFINEIIKKSKLETTIKKLPNGIRTIIGERGSKISAGQKQRLAIARALYRKPKILVMDEPTSSLDKINENMIINNITKIKNLTVIVITHNQQILKKFDRVFFLGKNNSFKIIKKNR